MTRNYSTAEVAELARRSPATVRRWRESGFIRPVSDLLPNVFPEAELVRLGLVTRPGVVGQHGSIPERVRRALRDLAGP